MIYADFEYYRDTYHGVSVLEADYPGYAVKASAFLDYYTMGKAADSAELDAVKLACCALAEKYAEIEMMMLKARESMNDLVSGNKKSESIGSYSVTYQNAEDVSKGARQFAEELKKDLPQIARAYLTGTGLLYRGGGVCTHRTL